MGVKLQHGQLRGRVGMGAYRPDTHRVFTADNHGKATPFEVLGRPPLDSLDHHVRGTLDLDRKIRCDPVTPHLGPGFQIIALQML